MTDIEIARCAKLQPIIEIAKKLNLNEDDITCYGKYKAKLEGEYSPNPNSKLILVTAINPTKFGEGKTTVAIGLADALNQLGHKAVLALREPSMGPVFGMKGGATGGGYSQIAPMEDINLHFTGDFHAITAANNLLSALIDNHIFQGNELEIEQVLFNRCLDVNDRALRNVQLAERSEKFNITAASEVMAILCMARDLEDLKYRLSKIIIGKTKSGKFVTAGQLGAHESMAVLLKDAIKVNLVQSLEATPALVHCGPFANIAHGCNSVRATLAALKLGDYAVTEAGFGCDLGGEKFLDFKCRQISVQPACVVIVATIRALKFHGNGDLKKGYKNLEKHIDTIKNVFKLPYVVTLNKFDDDSNADIATMQKLVKDIVINDVYIKGGAGGKELAKIVVQKCQNKSKMSYVYKLEDSIEVKLEKIVKKVYGGKGVVFSDKAKIDIKEIIAGGYSSLPIIVAKTQYSLSADDKLLGCPKNFTIPIKEIQIRAGAGFLVAVCGNMLLMPALPKCPNALKISINKNGDIIGLY